MPSALRVVITDCDLGEPDLEREILLAGLGPDTEVELAQCQTEDDVVAAAAGADALLVQWAPVTRRVVDSLDRCKIISRYGIGLDMIDLPAARERGIEVANVPHYCTEEVATHASALLLALWRRLPQLDQSVRSGQWQAGAVCEGVGRLSSATLGLVGSGCIAGLVARTFQAMGCTVVAFDPYATPAAGIEFVDLPELARRSNLVSLHCPLTSETRHIVGNGFLTQLQPGAVLVNTARGELIDLAALEKALRSGHLGGAGLDVFPDEPLALGSTLRSTPNTLLSPHAAWCSDDALPALRAETARNVVEWMRHSQPGQPASA